MFVEAFPWTQDIYMTIVKRVYQGDRIFPISYVQQHFEIVSGEQTDDLYFIDMRRVR